MLGKVVGSCRIDIFVASIKGTQQYKIEILVQILFLLFVLQNVMINPIAP